MDRTRLPIIAPLFAVIAVALRATPEVSDQLMFERGGPSLLDFGRLFTCHLVHWNWEHLLWDVAVFAVVGSWCERLDRRAFAVFIGLAAIAIPPIVLAAHPELDSYAGLSGIDVGAVIFAVTLSLIRMVGRAGGRRPESLEAAPAPRQAAAQSRMVGRARGQVSRKPGAAPPPRQAAAQLALVGLLGIAVVAKVVFEVAAGRTVMFDAPADFVPVPLAHLVGVCVGLVVALSTVAKNLPVRQDRTA